MKRTKALLLSGGRTGPVTDGVTTETEGVATGAARAGDGVLDDEAVPFAAGVGGSFGAAGGFAFLGAGREGPTPLLPAPYMSQLYGWLLVFLSECT